MPDLPEIVEALDTAISEAEHFWAQCLDSYADPEAFGHNLAALVQSLRNATFRLQSHKAEYDDFDTWYEPWRSLLADDATMVWVNKARIEVVKRKGLRKSSSAYVEILGSYDGPWQSELMVDPLLPTEAIALRMAAAVPELARGNILISVTRRWVADGLPDTEVLTAAAHAIRILRAMKSSLTAAIAGTDDTNPTEWVAQASLGPGIEESIESLTVIVDPSDGSFVSSELTQMPFDPELFETATVRYGLDKLTVDASSVIDDVMAYAEQFVVPTAKTMLEKDGYHSAVVLLHDSSGSWMPVSGDLESRAAKYAFWEKIGDLVESEGYDAFIAINEVWIASPESVGNSPYPDFENLQDRLEGLSVYAETKSGQTRSWLMLIERASDGRLASVSEPTGSNEEHIFAGFAQPVRRAWSR